jgi:hypothetical protein
MMSDRVLLRVFLTFVALVAVIAGCAFIAFGAARLSVVSLGDGDRFSVDVTSADSQQGGTGSSALLSVVRHGDNLAVQIDRQNAIGETYAGAWQKDGTLAVQLADKNDPAPREVRDFNLVAGAIAGAPATPRVNDSWKANLEVPYSETKAIRVATQVTVVAVTADVLELQAIGRGKVVPSGGGGRGGGGRGGRGYPGVQNEGSGFPGSTFPSGRHGSFGRSGGAVDVALNLAARFAGGRLVVAKGTIQTTPEGEDEPDRSLTWTLAPHR